MTTRSRQTDDRNLVERWRLIGRAACDKKLSRTDIGVLFAILDSMYYGKPCFMNLNTIAGKCGASSTHVAKSVTRLLAGGYMDRTRSSGPGRANVYRLPVSRTMTARTDSHMSADSNTHMSAETGAECLSDPARECVSNAAHQTEIEANRVRKQGQDTTSAVRCLLADRGFNLGSSRSYIERFVAAGGTASVLADYLAMRDAHGKPANWTLAWATRELTEPAAPINASAGGKTLQAIQALQAFRQPRVGLADRWQAMDAIDADCIALEPDQAGAVRK